MIDQEFGAYLASNPLHGLPLETRADLERAMHCLVLPLDPYRSQGSARVRLSPYGAVFDPVAAEIEGFARPLWAVASAAAGGSTIDWGPYREGLSNGTNPDHPEYWGALKDIDQRLVELAAVGFALMAAREHIFDPLSPEAKAHVRAYLFEATGKSFSPNNWMFFRLLIDAGLRATGDGPSTDSGDHERAALDALYLGEGWYRDGPGHRVDHYNGFAFHTYGLLLHHFAPETDRRDHLQRARLFAPQFALWFDEAGRGLPFGRSMTYRFGMIAFFATYALVDPDPVLPMGVLKGIILRNLRWWADQPIADRDGVLSIGYAYPNPHMAEDYNSPGSPYWAMKAFIMLAMPPSHPFWTCDELPLPDHGPSAQPAPRFLIAQQNGAVVALSGGQRAPMFRHGAEKYGKLCYSSANGFCVEMRDATPNQAAFDNNLVIRVNGERWRARQDVELVDLTDNHIHTRWTPDSGVTVDTFMCFCGSGHIRVHSIECDVDIGVIESGFAGSAARPGFAQNEAQQPPAAGFVQGEILMDLSDGPRQAQLHFSAANVSLFHPHVAIPRLQSSYSSGRCQIASFCGTLHNTPDMEIRAALSHLRARASSCL